ncbi:hypothetical protein [Pseudomarimonas salicorniae]|uniref:Alpha-tubulin suppressor n=1 Tax=Pseudomarimonas salicorniae TaxID=2933270 RepID=A0ABT0GGF6_9GAMM|nr:hypothetical protein [Lysobacter sp. CAU 1642]
MRSGLLLILALGAALLAAAPGHAQLDESGNAPLTGLADYSVGRRQSCAVTTAGAAWCWGGSPDGQIGDGEFDDRFSPVPVVGLDSGVRAIAAGDRSSCAVMDTGAVKCWGTNTSFGLGLPSQPSTFQSPTPVDVPGVTNVRMIRAASAGRGTCVVDNADQVTCWGSPFGGPTGINNHETPDRLSGVDRIAVGAFGGCALLGNGSVKCWGNGSSGELGYDPSVEDFRVEARTVPGLSDSTVTHIAAGWFHRCAALSSGKVRCWGQNFNGELGRGSSSELEFTPDDVVGLPTSGTARGLVAGINGSCAEWDDGRVFCWGANSLGEFATSDTESSLQARQSLLGRADFRGLQLSMQHMCALDAEDALQCWGRADNGQLGTTATTDVLLPQRIGTEQAIEMALGSQSSCSLDGSGRPRCWGEGGALANGGVLQATPADVVGAAAGQVQLAQASFSSICARNALGEVRCWGSILGGERSPGDPPIAFGGPVASISAGASHFCALLQDGSVECFGDNAIDQLGNSSAGTESAVPVAVQGLPAAAIGVASGSQHSCALLADRRVACWGANFSAQLGVDGTSLSQSPAPQIQTAFSDVEQVGAGDSHTCARRADGSIWCWGGGNFRFAALGNGDSADNTPTPTQVLGLPGAATALTVSSFGGCALVAGEGWCWGWNLHGPVGDGTSRIRHRAARILLPGVTLVQIAQTQLHTCARSDSNALYCWGWNISGQVGNGEKSFSTEPERVLIDVLAREVEDVSDAGGMGAGEEESGAEVSGSGDFVVYAARTPATGKAMPPGPQRLLRRNRLTGAVEPVSVDGAGDPLGGDAMEPSVSANGQLVVFVAPKISAKSAKLRGAWPKAGGASGFGIYMRNMLTGSTTAVANAAAAGAGTRPQISASGNAIVFGREAEAAEGNPGSMNVFRVLLTPTIGGELSVGPADCQSCKSVLPNGQTSATPSNGTSSDPVVSADGKWLAFQTSSSNYLAGGQPCPAASSTVIMRNMLTGASRAASAPIGGSCGNGGATKPSLDYAGRNVVFVSSQPLGSGDNNSGNDVYLFDAGGQLRQISRGEQGSASDEVASPRISGDGRTVVFTSPATNLDIREPDNNDSGDLYVADLRGNRLARLAKNPSGLQVSGASRTPSLPYTGRFIAFDSAATDVTANSNAAQSSVYLRSNALAAGFLFEAGFE